MLLLPYRHVACDNRKQKLYCPNRSLDVLEHCILPQAMQWMKSLQDKFIAEIRTCLTVFEKVMRDKLHERLYCVKVNFLLYFGYDIR